MKIQIKSDLHKEARAQAYRASDTKHKCIMHPDADVLVLAGDITNYSQRFSLHYELTRLDGRPVIYVPGNHEYYQSPGVGYVVPELRIIFEDTHVQVMDRDHLIIDGVAFIGATLWSDLSNPLNATAGLTFLSDFRIPGLSVDWYNEQHNRSVAFLKSALNIYNKVEKKVVITHHSPSFLSCHPRFKGDAANSCFHTDLSEMMLDDHAPDIWIHGHTHDPFDYEIGKTRVICNPRGYPGEFDGRRFDEPEATRIYNDDLIIEI